MRKKKYLILLLIVNILFCTQVWYHEIVPSTPFSLSLFHRKYYYQKRQSCVVSSKRIGCKMTSSKWHKMLLKFTLHVSSSNAYDGRDTSMVSSSTPRVSMSTFEISWESFIGKVRLLSETSSP